MPRKKNAKTSSATFAIVRVQASLKLQCSEGCLRVSPSSPWIHRDMRLLPYRRRFKFNSMRWWVVGIWLIKCQLAFIRWQKGSALSFHVNGKSSVIQRWWKYCVGVEGVGGGGGVIFHTSEASSFSLQTEAVLSLWRTQKPQNWWACLSLPLFVFLCWRPLVCLVLFFCFGALCLWCVGVILLTEKSSCNLPQKKCSQKQRLGAVRIGAQRLTEQRVLTGSLSLCK